VTLYAQLRAFFFFPFPLLSPSVFLASFQAGRLPSLILQQLDSPLFFRFFPFNPACTKNKDREKSSPTAPHALPFYFPSPFTVERGVAFSFSPPSVARRAKEQ